MRIKMAVYKLTQELGPDGRVIREMVRFTAMHDGLPVFMQFKLEITDPAEIGKFRRGAQYYLDFTPVLQ